MMRTFIGNHDGLSIDTKGKRITYWNKAEVTLRTNEPFVFDSNPIYFEVTLKNCLDDYVLAIGFAREGSTVVGKGNLPGWVPGSWGYHSDDGKIFSRDIPPKRRFTNWDVVGCGISNFGSIYFTKNGQLVKVLDNETIEDGARFFPIIGLATNVTASFNLGDSPFRFDVLHPDVFVLPHQNPRIHLENQRIDIDSLPDLVWGKIMKYSIERTLCSLEQVSPQLAEMSSGPFGRHAWQVKCLDRWPQIPLKASNWKKFYRRRHQAVLDIGVDSQESTKPIENCLEWEFRCPITLDKLTRTLDFTVDYCSVCKKEVHLVRTPQELEQRVAEGQCVSIDFDRRVTKKREEDALPRSLPMAGRMVMRRF